MINIQPNVRNVPHIDGNYHTICYIKVEITNEIASVAKKAYNTLLKLENLNNVLYCEQPTQADSDYSFSDTDIELDSQNEDKKTNPKYVHLSLCKPIYLRRQFIDSFVEKLKNSLQNLKPFYLLLENKVSICANETLSRYFGVSLVEKMCRDNTILPIIDVVDQVVQSFGFDKYYSQRKPHVSLASSKDISLVLNELYKSVKPLEDVYSSNYWTNLDQYLDKADNYAKGSNNYYNASSVNYTFDFDPDQFETQSNFEDDKICVYVDEIHILVGSRDHHFSSMDNFEVDELKGLVGKQAKQLAQKDEMIKLLWLALNKAYSHYNFDKYEDVNEESKRHLIRNTQTYADSINNTPHTYLDESIFSSNQEKHESCMLCLFPINDSLHGSQSPKTYTLKCGHKFHLLCLYETVQRRECRKVCGECWIAIDDEEQDKILDNGRSEKRVIIRESKDIANKILKYKKY